MTFETFYNQHSDRVLRVLRGKLPACHVEDAAQEVWQRVALHFANSTPTPQWVNRIMANVANGLHRREHRRATIREFVPLSAVREDAAIARCDPADIVTETERQKALQAVYTASSHVQRQRVAGYITAMGSRRVSPAERIAMYRFRKILKEVTA